MPLLRCASLLLIACFAPAALPAALAGDGGFATGDLWLRSAVQQGTPYGALVRIDAATGASQVVLPFTGWQGNTDVYQTFCYDPWRDRILVYGTLTTQPLLIQKTRVWAVDGAGNATETPLYGGALAPAVDGKVYAAVTQSTLPPAFQYLDTNNVLHPVMEASGNAPFWPFSGGFAPGAVSLIYDAPSHSLLYAVGIAGTQCSPANGSGKGALYRFTLAPDGTRVLASACTTFDLDGTLFAAVGGYPTGFGRRSDGKYLLTLRGVGPLNGNDSAGDRMLLVDPQTLALTTFATSGPYPNAVFANAGTWSRVRDAAVLFDPTGNQLRAFTQGSSGGGVPFAIGAAGGSLDPSGFAIDVERAGLLEIGPLVPAGSLTGTPTQISLSAGGQQSLAIDFGAGHAGGLYFVLGSASGAVPGLVLDGQLLPLSLDSYLLYTLSNPNLPPFTNTLGLLDGTGKRTATITLAAGANPALAGRVLHHAALALSPIAVVEDVSDAISLRLVP